MFIKFARMQKRDNNIIGEIMKKGFTLAEVLITLGIIGVVAAIILPTVLSNIRNKGYVEKLQKIYSMLGQATKFVTIDVGIDPENWDFSHYNDGDVNDSLNRYILDSYISHFKVTSAYIKNYNQYMSILQKKKVKYYYLNGNEASSVLQSGYHMYHVAYVVELSDGASIGFSFSENKNGGLLFPLETKKIVILYIVDVNGLAKPNQIGRDIFYFALYKNGKLEPYNINDTSDCTKDGKGYSCAGRIFNEGKMNY